jgi:DNA repair protein RadC
MIHRVKNVEDVCITGSECVYRLMLSILRRKTLIDRTREHLWTIGLDNHNRVLYIEQVSVGCINACIFQPMEIFCMAVRKRCTSIVVVHNHSCSVEPSKEDIRLTEQLAAAGRILNIRLLDHLIISTTEYYSFADEGLLPDELTLVRRCEKFSRRNQGFSPFLKIGSHCWMLPRVVSIA